MFQYGISRIQKTLKFVLVQSKLSSSSEKFSESKKTHLLFLGLKLAFRYITMTTDELQDS